MHETLIRRFSWASFTFGLYSACRRYKNCRSKLCLSSINASSSLSRFRPSQAGWMSSTYAIEMQTKCQGSLSEQLFVSADKAWFTAATEQCAFVGPLKPAKRSTFGGLKRVVTLDQKCDHAPLLSPFRAKVPSTFPFSC